MVSNITGNNQWENCISLDFYFHGFSGPRNQQKLEPHDNDFTVLFNGLKKTWISSINYLHVHTVLFV